MNVFLCRGEYEETIVKETVLKLAAKMFWCFELGLGAFMMSESGRDFVYSYFNDQLWSPSFFVSNVQRIVFKIKKMQTFTSALYCDESIRHEICRKRRAQCQ